MEKEKEPPKVAWSAVCASYEEVGEALAATGLASIPFPVIGVPWGAERYGTRCRLFRTREEVTEEAVEELLLSAFPFEGNQSIHLISQASELRSPVWGTKWLDGPYVWLDER